MSRHLTLLDIADVQRLGWDPTEEPAIFTRIEDDIDTFELHHTGARGPRDLTFAQKAIWLLAIERAHELYNGWSDIFYHVFVFADGEIWIGRDLRRTSQGNISNAITVHIPGNNPEIPEAQHASLLRLARLWAASPDHIRDHQQRPAATACSGDNGRAEITRLREEYTMADHTHEYQDLTAHPDAVAAAASGLWNGSDPAGAASRSVVAVIAQRALDQALVVARIPGPAGEDGARGPRGRVGAAGADAVVTEAQLRNAITREMPAIVASVLAEIDRKLSA